MIGETAQLVVQLTLKDQLSGGVQKAERSLTGLNATTKAGVGHMSVLSVAAGKVSKSIGGLGGALSHASGKIGGLLSGPLGLIGLTGGILGLGGAIESSVHKLSDFGLGLEKVQTLTGETAQASGALILEFEKYGLGVDRVTQIAGFAEKTLGKLNATTTKGAAAAKSVTLQNLELVKAQRQAAGESTKAINKLITEQKARDKLTAAAAGQVASVTKLAAIDKTYGLSLVDTKGKVVDFSTLLEQLAKFYDSGASASTKAYVASQVLGRGYTALIPVLKAGSEGLRQAADEAKTLGLDQAGTVEKLAKFRTTMRDLGAQANILQLQIGMALVPALTDAAKALSGWLAGGGDQQILDFFKGAATFAQQFGHAIETFVVPGFKAIAGAWDAIPGPLKDLLIGGFVANKAGKFLFDKSLFSGAKGLLGGLLGKVPVVGGALDSAIGNVQHVWVDNLGPGGMGAGGLPVAGKVGVVSKIASLATKVFIIGAAVGVFAELKGILDDQSAANRQQATDLTTKTTDFAKGASLADLQNSLKGIQETEDRLNNSWSVEGLAFQANIDGVRTTLDQQKTILQDQIRQAHEDALNGVTSVTRAVADIVSGNRVRSDFVGLTNAVARGTELGLVHSGVFAKAQAVREAGGFKLSRDALISQLHSKTPLGNDALVTGQAIALAVGNHLRTDRNPDLKSAAANLALLKRLQLKLPADLAAKLAPKIHSLELAIDRTTSAVQAIKINVSTGFVTNGNWKPTPKPRGPVLLPGDSPGRGFASGAWDVPQDMLANIHKGEMILPAMVAARARLMKLHDTSHPISLDSLRSYLSSGRLGADDRYNVGPVRFVPSARLDPSQLQFRASYRPTTHSSARRRDQTDYGPTGTRPYDPRYDPRPIVIHTTVSTRDSINGQNVKGRYGKTSTQVGAA